MRMPEKMNGHSLTAADRIYPTQMGIDIRQDEISTATMTLDEDAPKIDIGDWVRVWAPNGQVMMMHVRTHEADPIAKTIRIGLEEVWAALDEMVMFEEIDASGKAEDAIKAALARQTESIFTFGGCDFADELPWKFTNTTVRSALTDISEAIAECQWERDYSVFPFRISLKKFPTESSMEMRRNRNLDTMQISLDRSQMYTRVYPIGNKDLHIEEGYLEMNTDRWGVISQVITDSSIEDEGMLRAWAAAQMRRNAEPVISISISGAELSEETGESLDRLICGRMCRVPLPEYGKTYEERLVRMTWRDCMADETSVTISLANQHKTIQGMMEEAARGGGASGRKSSVKTGCDLHEEDEEFKEFTTEYEQDMLHIEQRAIHWDESGAILQAAGMHIDNEGAIIYSTDNERQIGSQIVSLDDRASMMVGRYTITEDHLHRYAGTTAFPKEGIEGEFYVDVSTGKTYAWSNGKYNEVKVGLNGEGYYIKAGEIAIAINESGDSEALIDAQHIYIGSGDTKEILSEASKLYAQVVGTYAWETDKDGNRILRGLDGSGSLLWRDGAAYGLWDKGELDAGMFVTRDDGKTYTKIKGDVIEIGENGSAVSLTDTIIVTASGLAQFKKSVQVKGNLSVLSSTSGGKTTGGGVAATNFTVGIGGEIIFSDASGPSSRAGSLKAGDVYEMIVKAELDGNTLKLWPRGSSTPLTFSKATSLEPEWSGGKYTVKAYQNNDGTKTEVAEVKTRLSEDWTKSGDPIQCTVTGTESKTGKYIKQGVTVLYVSGSDENTGDDLTQSTGRTLQIITDAKDVYNAGWAAAYGKVSLPKDANTTSAVFTVLTPPSKVDDPADEETYTINNAAKNITIVKNKAGTIVARDQHNHYDDGWKAAFGKVAEPGANTSSGKFSVKVPVKTVDAEAGSMDFTLQKGTTPGSTGHVKAILGDVSSESAVIVAQVDIGDWYDAGWDAVTLTGPTWTTTDSKEIGISNTVKVTASNKKDGTARSKSQTIYLTQDDSFGSNHKKMVYMRDESVTGTQVGKIEIDASGEYGDGVTEGFADGNKNRGSKVLSLNFGQGTIDQELEADATYIIQSQYKKQDGTWATDGTRIIHTAPGTPYQVPVASGDYAAGWNAARAKVILDGNTVKRPKAMVEGGALDAGVENFKTATAYNGSLDKGSVWGAAKLCTRTVTPGGAGSWVDHGYQSDTTLVTVNKTEYHAKADKGYWGYTKEPSVGAAYISWS